MAGGTASAGHIRRSAGVVAATLLSGGFMAAGGYLFRTHGWHVGGPVMIPSGPAISVAFALMIRAERLRRGLPRAAPPGRSERVRFLVTVAAGMPWTGSGASVPAQAGSFVLTMAAGVALAAGGYAAAAVGWYLLAPSAVLGGVLIGAAFALAATALRSPLQAGP